MLSSLSSLDYVAMNLPNGSNVIPLAFASIILIGATLIKVCLKKLPFSLIDQIII